jgi:hypothetical protein
MSDDTATDQGNGPNGDNGDVVTTSDAQDE